MKGFNRRQIYQIIIDLCTDLNAPGPVQMFGFDEVGEILNWEGDLMA